MEDQESWLDIHSCLIILILVFLFYYFPIRFFQSISPCRLFNEMS